MANNPDEIGVLWEKDGANGKYFTGTINGQKVVVFANKFKKEERHPDWRVLISRPKEERGEEPPF